MFFKFFGGGVQGKVRPQLGRQSDSEQQDPSANVLNPRLNTAETLKPPACSGHLQVSYPRPSAL